MIYRTNPKNGDKLSILGFGSMRFSDNLAGSFGFGKKFDVLNNMEGFSFQIMNLFAKLFIRDKKKSWEKK